MVFYNSLSGENLALHVVLNTRKPREYCQWKIGLHMVYILY
jgi:hypothetical protein